MRSEQVSPAETHRGSRGPAGPRQHAARSPRTPRRAPARKYWRPPGLKLPRHRLGEGCARVKFRKPALPPGGGCPPGLRPPKGRPHDPEVRWPPPEVLLRSSAASHPGQPRCPLPTCAAPVLAAPVSVLSDTGDLPTGRLGAKRRADSSPRASGSRGPAPRPSRPDPDSRGAGGGARAARPAVPASSRRAVNSPGRAP